MPARIPASRKRVQCCSALRVIGLIDADSRAPAAACSCADRYRLKTTDANTAKENKVATLWMSGAYDASRPNSVVRPTARPNIISVTTNKPNSATNPIWRCIARRSAP